MQATAPGGGHRVSAPVTLYVLCGMSFAGKSTLATAIANHAEAAVVSLDAINEEGGLVGGKGVPDEEWARSHQIALKRVEEILARGRSVVIDDTNCFRFLRDDYRALASRLNARAQVLYLDAPEAVLRQRRQANDATAGRAHILEQVFGDLERKFEPPTADEQPLLVPVGADFPAWVANNIPSVKTRHVGGGMNG